MVTKHPNNFLSLRVKPFSSRKIASKALFFIYIMNCMTLLCNNIYIKYVQFKLCFNMICFHLVANSFKCLLLNKNALISKMSHASLTLITFMNVHLPCSCCSSLLRDKEKWHNFTPTERGWGSIR